MSNSTTITLTNVHCNSTSEHGHDEVYLKYTADGGHTKRFPSSGHVSMADGDDWDPNLPMSFKDSLVVELFDQDSLGDEPLGSHTYSPSDPQPETVPVSNPNGASYNLTTN